MQSFFLLNCKHWIRLVLRKHQLSQERARAVSSPEFASARIPLGSPTAGLRLLYTHAHASVTSGLKPVWHQKKEMFFLFPHHSSPQCDLHLNVTCPQSSLVSCRKPVLPLQSKVGSYSITSIILLSIYYRGKWEINRGIQAQFRIVLQQPDSGKWDGIYQTMSPYLSVSFRSLQSSNHHCTLPLVQKLGDSVESPLHLCYQSNSSPDWLRLQFPTI